MIQNFFLYIIKNYSLLVQHYEAHSLINVIMTTCDHKVYE